ncbi:MAG: thiolase family protein [Candidatus Humimicrobiaceae bacterium]
MGEKNAVIVSGYRTAIGKFGGSLKDVSASDLGAGTIKKNLSSSNINPEIVDEVIIGCVGQIAENALISRMCQLKAGIPYSTPALSVNRLCGSGLEAINLAAMKIKSNNAEIVVAGGTESLSNYPYYVKGARWGYKFGNGVFEDGVKTVYTDTVINKIMGETAESVAKRYSIDRKSQDEFALLSQNKALKAIELGKFKDEIAPVKIASKKQTVIFDTDEYPRHTSIEELSILKPAFLECGTVTAGNASGINDGAATVIVTSDSFAEKNNLVPLVKIVSYAVCGVEPEYMGIGPVYSTRKALKNANLSLSDIDVFEINEAFAAQSLAVIKELDLPINKVNVNGGAISLGHPIGATGAILVVKIINIMRQNKYRYGLVTLCIGGGQGITTIFELL